MKLKKLVTKYWVTKCIFFLDLFQGVGETVEIVYTFLYTLFYIVKYGETPFGERGTCENLGEYLVHARLDFNSKLQRCTHSAQVDQLVRSVTCRSTCGDLAGTDKT